MATDLGAADAPALDPPIDATPRVDGGRGPGGPFGPDRMRWLLPLVVIGFAAALRFAYLPHPERIYFDETYYATNAAQLLDYGVEAEPRVERDPAQGVDPVFVVHPPVGKWLIATGIAAFGDQSLGWRVASAVAGTLLVAATYFVALRMFRRRGVAALTAFLLSIEGLALTMSRIAMLDVFLALFVVLGVWALLIDRDRRWSLVSDLGRTARVPRLPRPHLWLAGIAFGLALATKWSGVLAIGAAGLYLVASELAWRRALTGSPWRDLWRLAGLAVGALLVVPAAVYVASYVSWFANFEHTRPGVELCGPGPAECAAGPTDIARGWYTEQREIFRFHRDLEVTHDYRAPAALWLVTGRPVVYYYEACLDPEEPGAECDVPAGTLEEIVGLGNPAIWWTGLAVYPFLLYAAIRRRDPVAATIAAFLLGQFVPWLGPSRPLFFFYALPLVPFVVLALGWAATHLLGRRGLRWVPVGVAAAALGAFVFWAPLYYGMRISEAEWHLRIWFDSWI